MNRLELLIILVLVFGLVILFLKSQRFDRFLDWLIGRKPKNADDIASAATNIKNQQKSIDELKEIRKKELETEHKKLENLDS